MSGAAGNLPLADASTIPLILRPNDTDILGDATSPTALAKLEAALAELHAMAIAPYLDRALRLIHGEKPVEACEWALKALNMDERCGFGWRLLGIAREMTGDYANAIRCYESALQLSPDDVEIANDIGRLAYTLDMKDLAGKLFAHFWQARPDLPDGANNFACVLRDQNRYEDAIDILKSSIGVHPENAQLWNTLATVVMEQGDTATAITFFDEAIRLDPAFVKAVYNRGNAKLSLLDYKGALADCDAALAKTLAPADVAMMKMARSTIVICDGRLGEGWDDYEVRLDTAFAAVAHFAIERPKWAPGMDIRGKSLLIMAEQGLGDEILFANVIPDVIRDLGPDGKLTIAVEPRLVDLFKRSFPTAKVGPAVTYKIEGYVVKSQTFVEHESLDLWVPMGSLLRQYRRKEEDFPTGDGFIKPDQRRVAHWKKVMKSAPQGPKIGLLWKSIKLEGSRLKFYSPFEQWAPVLKTPGMCFVNLQYGDCSGELALAEQELGVKIWTPPGIDLKNDLDDLAALCCTMDLIIGPSNATSNIAGAVGAPVWLIAGRNSWTRLGSKSYPWYPQVRMFDTPLDGDWPRTMTEVASELAKAY